VFTSALDIAQTETKGTVLLKNAEEMLGFTRGEEVLLEKVHTACFQKVRQSYIIYRLFRKSLHLASK
jgi:hypothetical protein